MGLMCLANYITYLCFIAWSVNNGYCTYCIVYWTQTGDETGAMHITWLYKDLEQWNETVLTIIFIEGYRVLTAKQVPASSVHLPKGRIITSTSSNWSTISNPMVPWPHTTSGLLFLKKWYYLYRCCLEIIFPNHRFQQW